MAFSQSDWIDLILDSGHKCLMLSRPDPLPFQRGCGYARLPFERALFDVRVFNPYAPSNRQPLIAKARPAMLAFRLVIIPIKTLRVRTR